eukprot:Plantae.Rhodophyta-Purpureofilum_apyrenoidigerum.ctg17860.p1 GENE.Plantae.Rhodophyta-Purpureofilum_apyrenoidigerum.ctg17860~~Plantae.Rhodophyta-Purpureofilum_apyrenoidigerum.ctg17860.p1  ORF type:complete len:278 (-),score=25.18 Plantae.Rhodophyta-Purpureofilum_apyrenoidigerum.ctg17860:237-1070(-)
MLNGLLPEDCRLLEVLLEKERWSAPDPTYLLSVQANSFSKKDRAHVVQWMAKNGQSLSLCDDKLQSAVNFFDRFLSKQRVVPAALFELASACLLVACKLHQAELDESDRSAEMSQIEAFKGFSEHVVRFEVLLLQTLEWRLHASTPYHFLQLFTSLVSDDSLRLLTRSLDIYDTIVADYDALKFRPSVLAVSLLLHIGDHTEDTALGTVRSLAQYIGDAQVDECITYITAKMGPKRRRRTSMISKGLEGRAVLFTYDKCTRVNVIVELDNSSGTTSV